MFKFIDRWLETKIKKKLHKKRQHYIEKTINQFLKKYPDLDEISFREKLNIEADRVYAIIDKSILEERIKRGKYIFWATLIIGFIIAAAAGTLTAGAALPIVLPIVGSFSTYCLSLATIPVSFNLRVQGAMDSVCKSQEREINKSSTALIHLELKTSPAKTPTISTEKKFRDVCVNTEITLLHEKLLEDCVTSCAPTVLAPTVFPASAVIPVTAVIASEAQRAVIASEARQSSFLAAKL